MTPDQAETLGRTAQASEDNKARIADLQTKVDGIDTKVDNIHSAVVRQKGFLGGVLWLWGILLAGATLGWNFLKS